MDISFIFEVKQYNLLHDIYEIMTVRFTLIGLAMNCCL